MVTFAYCVFLNFLTVFMVELLKTQQSIAKNSFKDIIQAVLNSKILGECTL